MCMFNAYRLHSPPSFVWGASYQLDSPSFLDNRLQEKLCFTQSAATHARSTVYISLDKPAALPALRSLVPSVPAAKCLRAVGLSQQEGSPEPVPQARFTNRSFEEAPPRRVSSSSSKSQPSRDQKTVSRVLTHCASLTRRISTLLDCCKVVIGIASLSRPRE